MAHMQPNPPQNQRDSPQKANGRLIVRARLVAMEMWR
jgi:hypothetical protein